MTTVQHRVPPRGWRRGLVEMVDDTGVPPDPDFHNPGPSENPAGRRVEPTAPAGLPDGRPGHPHDVMPRTAAWSA